MVGIEQATRNRSDGVGVIRLCGRDSIPSRAYSKSPVQNFKYPFSFAHKRVYEGGWSREVTVRELPVSKTLAGVNMRLNAGGVRELHWHTAAEWAIML
jgi:oxalate decarboxylase